MYAYNAELFCDDCAEAIMERLAKESPAPGLLDSGDSNEYPQYADNDESDCPNHCGDCDVFLYNALTTDGMDYVKDAVLDALRDGRFNSTAVQEWWPFYGLDVKLCLDVKPSNAETLATQLASVAEVDFVV
jgi:hypothetical protein